MRRILSATPIHVGDEGLARRRRRYAALAPEGVTVELINTGPAAPDRLETTDDVRASEAAVANTLATYATARHDHVLPDCVLDPGVTAPAATTGAVPQGMLRLVLETLASAGHRVAAVTRNAVIGEELYRKACEYGFGAMFLTVTVLELGVDSIPDARKWNAAVHAALQNLGDRGATAVINGCSAVEVTTQQTGSPLVVDPMATALRALGSEEQQ